MRAFLFDTNWAKMTLFLHVFFLFCFFRLNIDLMKVACGEKSKAALEKIVSSTASWDGFKTKQLIKSACWTFLRNKIVQFVEVRL